MDLKQKRIIHYNEEPTSAFQLHDTESSGLRIEDECVVVRLSVDVHPLPRILIDVNASLEHVAVSIDEMFG